ncbi:hypothetical protein Tco_1272961 [Tanacetum coccineum]
MFVYTCGSILNTIKGTTSTFDGVCHQKFSVTKVRNNHGESDNDDEEYSLKRNEMGKPFYGPNRAKYLSCDNLMDRALALQEALNHFKKIYVWKKGIAFLRSLPVPLQHAEWIPNRSTILLKRLQRANGTLRLELWTLTRTSLSRDTK